ncbi:MAG: rubrerythrin [Thalassospira sp.]|uniref:Rubrerythrin n=1 Tax=Thalassospira indica TaxID=1891279 RepID=A0ABN5NA31_9PROT|nr:MULTISPECIES: rubrerythrin family protein [Thalassospira]MBE71549.1 rubrerythrin [Thalassospira sp.]OAZ15162.1 rubrerythrin [Thalassospira profundimaris]BDW91082.1 rubrerythrin [Thalassospira tepidiphila]AXO12993.1 rubrerythrin [Thalassospira indica]QPO11886.1 rubrerythrin family protein [Thalassospira sp. A40-3]|tara:strand:- start:168 stop:602 length:435 start_codon:yes stop_codon:yes gene_type:complete
MALKGTRTEANLRAAFAAEAQTNRRYLYFAQQADIEGYTEAAELFRTAAEAETGHAFGHLEFLETAGDPLTGKELGTTRLNLEAAIAQEKDEAETAYPEMARIAREEGLEDIAAWFESLARVEAAHADRIERLLTRMGSKTDGA